MAHAIFLSTYLIPPLKQPDFTQPRGLWKAFQQSLAFLLPGRSTQICQAGSATEGGREMKAFQAPLLHVVLESSVLFWGHT